MATPLEHALAYAAMGIPVFPVHPATKRPLTAKGKSYGGLPPLDARWSATCDPAYVNAFWKRWPRAMIGLATGEVFNTNWRLVVVDVDAATPEGHIHDGIQAFMAEAAKNGQADALGRIRMVDTPFANTPSGGCHIYYKVPKDMKLRSGPWLKGVDIKAHGGYVIAAPSARADGKVYSWERCDLPTHGTGSIDKLPGWIIDSRYGNDKRFMDKAKKLLKKMDTQVSHERVVEIVATIVPWCEYDPWCQVGMALYHIATPGDTAALSARRQQNFELWRDWSGGGLLKEPVPSRYAHRLNPRSCTWDKWESFSRTMDEPRLQLAGLIGIAEQNPVIELRQQSAIAEAMNIEGGATAY